MLLLPMAAGSGPLIELASRDTKNVGAFELLVSFDAIIERPLSATEHAMSALPSTVKARATELVSLLIGMGARLNNVYRDPPGTALGAAIEKGDISLMQMFRFSLIAEFQTEYAAVPKKSENRFLLIYASTYTREI